MATGTICSDFRAQEEEICHCFHIFPFCLPWTDGTGCHDLSFLILSFKLAFLVSSFTLITRLFSSSLLSAIRVVSSAYLRLLIFLPAILIPAYNSSSPAFCTMCSACKLNKQGNNKQFCCTPFSILNQSFVPYKNLLLLDPHTGFSGDRLRWSVPISLRIFHSLLWSTVRGFSVVYETEVDIFLEFPCFLNDPANDLDQLAIWSLRFLCLF